MSILETILYITISVGLLAYIIISIIQIVKKRKQKQQKDESPAETDDK